MGELIGSEPGGLPITVGAVPASSTGTTVTAGTGNAKGVWAQLTAALEHEAAGLLLIARANSTAQYLLDIGIGAALSEQVIIPDLHLGTRTNQAVVHFVPLTIPAGARIAARCQSSTNSATLNVVIVALPIGPLGMPGLRQAVQYGADASDSGATSVDPGATANTDGSWVVLTTSTTQPTRALTLVIGIQNNAAPRDATWLFDIAVDTGPEVEIISDLLVVTGSSVASGSTYALGPFPVSIPAGRRLSVRARSSTNDATDRLLDAQIITYA